MPTKLKVSFHILIIACGIWVFKFNKEETSFDLVFLNNGIDVVEETQHHLTEYKSIKEVIDSGTLIVIQVKEDAPIYFEKKNATKDQYEEIRNIFEKNNILCNMKEL